MKITSQTIIASPTWTSSNMIITTPIPPASYQVIPTVWGSCKRKVECNYQEKLFPEYSAPNKRQKLSVSLASIESVPLEFNNMMEQAKTSNPNIPQRDEDKWFKKSKKPKLDHNTSLEDQKPLPLIPFVPVLMAPTLGQAPEPTTTTIVSQAPVPTTTIGQAPVPTQAPVLSVASSSTSTKKIKAKKKKSSTSTKQKKQASPIKKPASCFKKKKKTSKKKVTFHQGDVTGVSNVNDHFIMAEYLQYNKVKCDTPREIQKLVNARAQDFFELRKVFWQSNHRKCATHAAITAQFKGREYWEACGKPFLPEIQEIKDMGKGPYGTSWVPGVGEKMKAHMMCYLIPDSRAVLDSDSTSPGWNKIGKGKWAPINVPPPKKKKVRFHQFEVTGVQQLTDVYDHQQYLSYNKRKCINVHDLASSYDDQDTVKAIWNSQKRVCANQAAYKAGYINGRAHWNALGSPMLRRHDTIDDFDLGSGWEPEDGKIMLAHTLCEEFTKSQDFLSKHSSSQGWTKISKGKWMPCHFYLMDKPSEHFSEYHYSTGLPAIAIKDLFVDPIVVASESENDAGDEDIDFNDLDFGGNFDDDDEGNDDDAHNTTFIGEDEAATVPSVTAPSPTQQQPIADSLDELGSQWIGGVRRSSRLQTQMGTVYVNGLRRSARLQK